MKRKFAKIVISVFFGFLIFGCQKREQDSKWTKLPSPISAQIRSFAESSDGTLYAGTSELYKSIDRGDTWELMDFKHMPLEVMETQDGTLLVGTYRDGIFRSIDKGETWTNVGFEKNVYIFKIIQTSNGRIFASATFLSTSASEDDRSGVFMSENDGLSWKQTSITTESIKGVFNPKDGFLFAYG